MNMFNHDKPLNKQIIKPSLTMQNHYNTIINQ